MSDKQSYPCDVHSERINALEKTMDEMSATVKRLELMAASAMGSVKTLLFVQPFISGVLTGLVVYYLTRR